MTWAEKHADWGSLKSEIRSLLAEFQRNISDERTADIEHYLEHGELSAAFEYLVLEIMECGIDQSYVNLVRLRELGLFFDLNDENECMIDGDFWPKFQKFASQP
jgi:hypothetical protein